MGRIVNTNDPGKRRNAYMRDAAELLRHLMIQPTLNNDTKDMLAQLVFSLRDIDNTIEESASAWEKRGYWKKSDEFRERWMWAGGSADSLAGLVRREDWAALPTQLTKMFPHFSEINITKFTRDESLWRGAYDRLLGERA